MNISLDIIIPTLNCSETIGHTLFSLGTLINRGASVTVVDSYSTDQTVRICNQFNVPVIYTPAGNMYSAINQGIAIGSGEWVTYINGDDVLYGDAVLAALGDFQSDSDVIYGSVDFMDEVGRFLHSWSSAHRHQLRPLFARGTMPIPQQGTLFRRSVAKKLGGFSLQYKYASDFDFFLRAEVAGFRFARLSRPRIGAFRILARQLSQRKSAELRLEVLSSVEQCALDVPRIQMSYNFMVFRCRNWDSYVLRGIRANHSIGRYSVGRSI